MRDLAARARERRLQPDEYTGGTFSISNLGMFEIDQFTAVINPPEAGILAIGSVAAKPVAEDGKVAVRRRMRVTMSCDHRVIDGATGAGFLRTLKPDAGEPSCPGVVRCEVAAIPLPGGPPRRGWSGYSAGS